MTTKRQCAKHDALPLSKIYPKNVVVLRGPCADCGDDTTAPGRLNEYYLLRHSLWKKVRRHPRFGYPKLNRFATLCLVCVEERLDRKLKPDDFITFWPPATDLLLDRAGVMDLNERERLQKIPEFSAVIVRAANKEV